MRNPTRSFLLKYCITVALALGTAWAIRGQFGHEYGAAWAGAIGMLMIVALSGRKDWYARLPAIVAVSAIGWGASGIMSYGMVVGYGRSDSFINVLYGLSMLFVIGSLYGIIGGGFSGLMLEEKKDRKVNWPSLLTQMIAGGFLFWAVLIYQLGYTMTPPRSELWAASLGSSAALVWFLYRNGYHASLRVALWAALGAGFGFAFGNFLQTLGTVTAIHFNWWNVMEYSIGFFGGLGMSYGIGTGKWPEKKMTADLKLTNLLGAFLLVIILPLINMIEAAPAKRFLELGQSLGYDHLAQFVRTHQLIAWTVFFVFAVLLSLLAVGYARVQRAPFSSMHLEKRSRTFFFLYLVWFMVLSNLVGGTWINGSFTSQHLYWINLLAIALLLRNCRQIGYGSSVITVKRRRLAAVVLIMIMTCIIIMSLISVHSHHGLPGMQYRF